MLHGIWTFIGKSLLGLFKQLLKDNTIIFVNINTLSFTFMSLFVLMFKDIHPFLIYGLNFKPILIFEKYIGVGCW